MKGTTKITLNQETVEAAIQDYFIKKVFDASQIATVKAFKPVAQSSAGYGNTAWEYEVTVESPDGGPEPLA